MSAKIEAASSCRARLLSALFYGVTSFLIILVNKTVLTSYRFPSSTFLGVGQMGFTLLILYIGKVKGIITFPDFDREIPRKLFPLPLLYIGNHLTGLSSTQKLSLPMFTVLRKFSILFTLLLEIIILRKRYSLSVTLSILAIVIGAFIAASFDLSFNLEGYIIVLLNDLFTAAYGVYTKEKINPKELGKYGVLFYNAAFMILPTLLYTIWTGEFEMVIHFSKWTNIYFAFQFLLACMMGFILLYAIVLCSYHNSALTTTVVGALKNVSIAYIGIFIGGDYIFSWLNFIGLNICMAGGAAYSFITFWEAPPSEDKHPNLYSREEQKTAFSQVIKTDQLIKSKAITKY
ncbi:UDP-N-acetylglucosamine/UDP-glucose/GDP-mannose transporter isoform X1 [Bufo bufo]|uniref:UDP-N-acetylglucosamine/UDP-glucose/GDP-mannose transporter isoform X1 n=1 Tax=Bufo bufo TaxID=8384 RepID=UPI001ABEABF5|nr:UDP-N-acetylglucosamine/UDP-glucose/GDP-mannose transporter isoform X1 [Bufo bufo]